ncbi:MAG: MBL fold metallo-hydrolase [Clostridiales bacterium]|nr:MBL fold metallo-hydrolase [Clostridiales bacterium]
MTLEGRDDAILIDPGSEPEKIKSELGAKKVAACLLTHGHWDHTGALMSFAGAPLYMHEGDLQLLQSTRFKFGDFDHELSPRPEPTDFITDGQVLMIAGITLQVLHTPGHTPGGVCYVTANDVFTGDTIFDGDYGRTDLPGGSMQQMRQSLRNILSLHGLYAHPGHGNSFMIP